MASLRASRILPNLSRNSIRPVFYKSASIPLRTVATYCPPTQAKAISALPTNVDPSSEEYTQNASQMKPLLDHLSSLTAKIHQGGPPKAREKHLARKKMLPRDRITALIDPADVPAGGIITGVGVIEGVTCMVVANDSTVKGGTYYPITVKKHLRAQEIAKENNLPCIYLVDSLWSWVLVRQVVPMFPPCLTKVSSSANKVIFFLAGPPLVKAATGEVVTAEELGGGNMHSSVSGVTDYLAVDDAHAIVLARRSISNLNWPTKPFPPPTSYTEPLYSPEELTGIATTNLRKPLPIHEVIARIVDGSFAHIYGHKVGIIANNGILFSASSLKGAHFIELCTQRQIPLIFLQNISGFMVGTDAEREGIAKNGAKLVTAVACANVPKFTVVVVPVIGAGNYGMCGRAYSPRFLWMWPNARIGVMGSEQLTAVMETVGKAVDPELRDRIDRESEAVFSSARLWDDGIIPPSHTREGIGVELDGCIRGEE
ncbi:hypothetical protein DID88_007333 [Monilinia fructigena]|uniref:CoA carboxyltransferase C-terminal domain-containing protein n=1 Tax=Monilinia fructigena TaxID=38457 RepID=A0A395J841_9HELO|nr:hypothetical protein DID88_007333 [Monilinia fructigena]